MARTDVAVLGAGIVGTSVAAQLARRGLSVALVDRAGPGLATSYGNAGIIEGNTVFPPAFPADPMALLRIALKLAPEANYHLSFLPRVLPWLMRFRANSALPRPPKPRLRLNSEHRPERSSPSPPPRAPRPPTKARR